MEGDYSRLEDLLQDVTSLDTARMSLRWALERLNSVERLNRELDGKLRASTQGQESAERRMREMEATVTDRMRLLADQEAFYRKLEQTVALLSEGKIDLSQLARKEVDADRLRLELSEQHRGKLEELEKSHREAVTRWTQRLAQAEAYAPERLSEAIGKYDEYRRGLDKAHQERLAGLEAAFHEKEQWLLRRGQELDADWQAKLREGEAQRARLEARVQERSQELETAHQALREEVLRELAECRARLCAEHLARRQELEAEAERLKEQIHQDHQRRTSAWRKDQERGLAELQQAWDGEKQRLLDEQKALQGRLEAALKRIGELQEVLAASDLRGRGEIVEWLSEAERTFQLKTEGFARAQTEARAALERRERQVQEEFDQRTRESERREAVAHAKLAGEYEARLKAKEDELAEERSRASRHFQERDALVRQMQERVRALEDQLGRAQSEEVAAALDELRAKLALEYEQLAKAREAEYADRIETRQHAWEEERERLRAEAEGVRGSLVAGARAREEIERKAAEAAQAQLGAFEERLRERDAMIRDLQDQLALAQTRLIRAESTEEAAAIEDLRVRLTDEFERALKSRDAESARRIQEIEAGKAAEIERSRQESGRAQEAWSARVQELDRRRAEAEGALAEREKAWESQLRERDALARDLKDQLALAQARLARAESTEEAAAIEELRAKLTHGFDEALKTREEGWEAERKRLLAHALGLGKEARWVETSEQIWEVEKSRLLEELARRDRRIREAAEENRSLQERLRGVDAAWRDRLREIAAVSERYLEELNAREKQLRSEGEA